MTMTTVQVRSETKEKLNGLKLHPRETYDELIDRLADAAYDDEPLSAEELDDIKASENDIKAGRIRNLRDIMKDLGEDKAIQLPGE
jgi:predicted transcriptional regulator